ncbi:hypothetical protein Pcinc_030896 [Petrolisthes cinctipes]|uniref:Schlafen AlbA-2 domain-containing protein n=1 Tax=Petrolisthes cinctipes TaxID=88211 RepID=A0AAE1EXT1_PETCI|nr:hypothetical protein Pcinc_030896 [Petrolisthes cinctipes]
MSTPGSINTNRSRYARLLGIMTAGGGRGRARNSANITFGLDVEEKEKKDSHKHKEKSDDDDDSSKHKEKSDDDDSRKHKEKSDDDDDSSKHKEKSDDDDDSSKHKEKSDDDDDSHKHKEKSDDDDDSSKHKEKSDDDDDSSKHKEKSDDDDDSSKHKEKSDDDDDSSKHKEKSDDDDDSSKHKEKSDDDDSSKHKENNLSALDYSVCDDHNDSPEFDCRVHHKNSNLSECNCSVNGESDLPAMDNNECKDYNSTNLHDFNKHTGRKSYLPGHNLNKSREGSMPELNINLCTEAVKQPHSSAHQSFSVPQSNHKTEQGNSVPVKINHRGPIFGNNNVNIRIPSDCSESEEEMEKSAVSNVYFAKVMDQLNTFYLRIKACSYTQSLLPYQTQEMNTLSRLEEKLNWLRKTTTTSELNERLRSFTLILQADVDLSSSFLSNFLNYIQSVMELEKDLTSVTEILQILVPSVNTMLRSTGVKEDVVKSIQNDNLVYSIYQSVVSTFSNESQYSSKSIKALLGFQCGDAAMGGRSTKAHVVRMTPQESVAVFQDTFGDKGNQFDMYLIYVWQVYKVYEVRHEDGSEHPLVHSLMDVIEGSGKYLSILRAKELQAKEHSDPFSTQFNNKMKDDAEKSLHPVPEANFEWTDFRLGRVNANGVAFLVNSPEWVCQLKELSTDIEKLEVKKRLKDVPSLGLTLGLELKSSISILDPNNGEKGEMLLRLTYIRVRVVRTAGPVVRVYGVDTGTVHTCPDPLLLILLPPPLVQHPPCGRLARLPVVPCPASSHLAPQLAFLVALCQRPDLTQYLCAVDISPTASWLQVPELTQLTLHLLETLLDTLPNSHLLPHISLIIADYLLRGTGGDPKQSPCTNLAVSLLTTAMTTSPRLRLMLANEGLFITLCELGLNGEDYHQAWESLVTLLGGRTQVEKWASLTHRAASNVHHSKHHHKVTPKSIRMPSKPVDVDRSLGILHLSTLATRDRNWDLEIRRTLTTRQLCPYQSHGGWQWDQAEVVACDVGKLHHGHILSVRSDPTHHLIVDKCISNIRMNTLLQVILGMLNTGVGGKVYIGLTQAGVVQGVRMTRDQRDCFMLGFSKMVTSEITPSLLPCDSLIQMVPVLRPATPQTHFHPNHIDYFIIVLTVRPQPELIYRCRDDPVPVLVRGEGGATTTLRGPILTRTLAQAKTCTQALQQKVASEKENLLKMIWDEKSRQ